MARLGKESPEELYEPSDDSPVQRGIRSRIGTTKSSATSSPSKRRSSSRKPCTTSARIRDNSDSDTEEEQHLQSKKTREPLQRPRQVKLTPLTSTLLKSYISDPGLEDEANQASEPKQSLFAAGFAEQTKSRKSKRSPGRVNDFTQPEDVVQQTRSSRGSQQQIEESSCSGDELPSVRELLTLRRRITPSRKADLEESVDLLEELKGLTLSTESKSWSDPKVVHHGGNDSVPASRPTTASGEENPTALLRFSPPRLYSPSKQLSDKEPATPPHSPPKNRLNSPSKWRRRIPTPPYRQSLDAFWDINTVNDWNDDYSPEKPLRSPKKMPGPHDKENTSPISSPGKSRSPAKRPKAALAAKQAWDACKQELAEKFLSDLDNAVAGGEIRSLTTSTGGVKIVWSKTLNTTAGRAHWRHETTKGTDSNSLPETSHHHHAKIELAEKVIDNEDRLLNVLAHEFCHLCNFIISGIKKEPHGKQFKAWGKKCTQAFGHHGVTVTTKHAYQIDYKFLWQCTNEDCVTIFKRHSKSIDPRKQRCGACKGSLVQIKPTPRKDANGNKAGYAAFVKAHFAEVKQGMSGMSHKEVMVALSQRYRDHKLLEADCKTPDTFAEAECARDRSQLYEN